MKCGVCGLEIADAEHAPGTVLACPQCGERYRVADRRAVVVEKPTVPPPVRTHPPTGSPFQPGAQPTPSVQQVVVVHNHAHAEASAGGNAGASVAATLFGCGCLIALLGLALVCGGCLIVPIGIGAGAAVQGPDPGN